jgi:hypothetical protein
MITGKTYLRLAFVLMIVALTCGETATHRISAQSPSDCVDPNAWGTYGHDARRSFASNGCVWYPLVPAWSQQYQPVAAAGRLMNTVERAIADQDGIYLTWNSIAYHATGTGTPALDRVSNEGSRVWTADPLQLNDNLGNWPTLWTYEFPVENPRETRQGVVRNDDGLRVWNKATGPRFYTNPPTDPRPDVTKESNDSWGESLVVGDILWVYNQRALHGPDLSLRAFDRRMNMVRVLNNYGWYDNPNHSRTFPQDQWDGAYDNRGTIASDNGYIYLGTSYTFICNPNCQTSYPPPYKTGIYAFNTADGQQRWPMIETTLLSGISVAGNRLYMLERDTTNLAMARLLIRNAGYNGSVLFASAPFEYTTYTSWQAPVLAGGRVIVATSNASQTVLRSWSAIDGSSPLSNTFSNVTGVKVPAYYLNRLEDPGASYGSKVARITSTIAAATGSKNGTTTVPTLIMTSDQGIHVVQVSNLQELWSHTKNDYGYTDGGRFRDPIVIGKRVYVVDNLRLYAFDAP